MATMDILYLGIVGVATYLAYSTGLLDQAGQALVQATAKKQASGWGKRGGGGGRGPPKHITILEQPLTYPFTPKRVRLTIA